MQRAEAASRACPLFCTGTQRIHFIDSCTYVVLHARVMPSLPCSSAARSAPQALIAIAAHVRWAGQMGLAL